MTIDIVCPSCGRLLRIAAEHAGKQIRCPACQQVSISPAATPAATAAGPNLAATSVRPSATPDDDTTLWHVRTPEGAVYGPIRWDVVVSWAEEGRVADDCELAQSAEGPWQPAARLIPGLGRSVLTANDSAAVQQAVAAQYEPPQQPFAATWPAAGSPGGPYLAPHRAPLVLVMGLLGFFIGCPVFSVIAWILGSRDLKEMRAGRMDRSGESVTLVGMILGMALSILWLALSFILLTIFLVAVGMQF